MSPHPADTLAAAAAAIDAGELARAETMCRSLLTAQPANGQAKLLLARARRLAGANGDAVALAEAAARQMPRDPAPRLEAALAYAASGSFERAVSAARKALRLQPASVPALLVFADALQAAGKPAEALQAARRAAALAPGIYAARFALGNALFDAQRFADAAEEFDAAAGLAPEAIDARYNQARALINLRRFGEAETHLRQCIERQPGARDAYENLASLYLEQDRGVELLAICELAIARCTQAASFWQLQADWHLMRGEARACLDCHARALDASRADDPGAQAQVRTNRALALLTLGQFAEGWREMRWRCDRAEMAQRHARFVADPAALPQDLSGKRLLLVQEQGLGDELFFLRYAPQLKARGATLHYLGEPKMHAILGARRDLFERLLPRDARPEGIDYTLLSGDLPEAAGAALLPPALPRPLPIAPDPLMQPAMSARLAELGPPPYIGVTWRAGLAADTAFRARKVRLSKEVPVAELAYAINGLQGTVLVLQRNPAPGEIELFSRLLERQGHDFSSLNERLGEMIALLSCLQGYVGVSNANIHLGACVGLQCRVLVTRQPEWRWGAQGDSTPWFPGFSLYRQQPDGGWGAPLGRLLRNCNNPPVSL